MFAIIHNKWLEELERRRLKHESGEQIDFVRTELKYGLAREEAKLIDSSRGLDEGNDPAAPGSFCD